MDELQRAVERLAQAAEHARGDAARRRRLARRLELALEEGEPGFPDGPLANAFEGMATAFSVAADHAAFAAERTRIIRRRR